MKSRPRGHQISNMEGGTKARMPYAPECFDEALDRDGEPRGAYAELLPGLEQIDLAEAAEQVQGYFREQGIDFKGDEGPEEFTLDVVPRLIGREEWEALEAGLIQRARALN